MKIQKDIPPFIKAGAWALSLITFIVGFWHTHLGLKQIHFFNSEYGSLAIAGIVLILLLISYWYAINITKWAIVVYIICGSFFFVFNLNYFYPAYLARTLVIDEARVLKDTLQTYANSADKIFKIINGSGVKSFSSDVDNLLIVQADLEKEIRLNGAGPKAQSMIDKANAVLSKDNKPILDFSIGLYNTKTKQGMDNAITQLTGALAQRIAMLEQDDVTGGSSSPIDKNLVKGIKDLKDLRSNYTPQLDSIIIDNRPIDLESIQNHPQVLVIKKFVQDLNQACSFINKNTIYFKKISDHKITADEMGQITFPELRKEDFPRADKLGTIKHTITSIKERVHEIDTWAIILVCLFIDLLVPLAMYMFLRKREDEEEKPRDRGIDTF